jgi:hypothetical protein
MLRPTLHAFQSGNKRAQHSKGPQAGINPGLRALFCLVPNIRFNAQLVVKKQSVKLPMLLAP